MSSFGDFNQRVLGGAQRQNKFVDEIKALLESTKAALDKEQTALSSAKEETATFADEVEGLKAKISNVEKAGNDSKPSRVDVSHQAPALRDSKMQVILPENNYQPLQIPKLPVLKESSESRESPAILHSLRADLKTKDDTLSTLVRTNAALSRQLEELRTAGREQERAYFELLKLVDGVTAALVGELPITKPTAFYIEERHRSLVSEAKALQEKLKNMKELNLSISKELDEARAGIKRLDTEMAGFRSRVSLAESQSQLLRSERDRALASISDLNSDVKNLKNENNALQEKYMLEIKNLKEEFKKKFKASVWTQSGMSGSKNEGGNVEMIIWADESVTVETTMGKLRSAAAARDLSTIMAIMSFQNERTSQSAALQELACSLLSDIAANERNQPDILASGVLDAVLVAMHQHIDSLAVQEQAMKILTSLGSNEANKDSIAEKCVGDILLSIRLHVDEVALQGDSLIALSNLCSENSIREIIEFGLDDILRSMRKHGDVEEIQKAIYEILHLLTNDDANAKIIGERGLIEIVDSMRQQADNEGLQESSCSVLCNLARDDDNRQAIMELALADIFAAMRRHKSSAGVQEKACAALGNLAADDNNTALIAEEGLADILEAMSQHMERPGVVQYACTALWYLTTNPKQLERIAEYGLDIILTAVSSHMADSEVLGQACGALLNLSLEPRSCGLMVDAGCAQTMLLILQEHAEDQEIDTLATRILSQLQKAS